MFALMLPAGAHSKDIVRHLDNSRTHDLYSSYFVSLLQLALDKSVPEYGQYELIAIAEEMRQSRQLLSLENDILDIMWTVTSAQRESQALAVRIPLLKGLIGHRVFIIRKDLQDTFSSASHLDDLSSLIAVQGHDWPDATILENAGLSVARQVWNQSFYRLIESGNADYYPRSVLEVISEMNNYPGDQLAIERQHLLVYPSAMYFFVKPGDKKLAQRVEAGLRIAINDGSFDTLFYSYADHVQAINQLNLDSRIAHHLRNPLLPAATPIHERDLWFTPFTFEDRD